MVVLRFPIRVRIIDSVINRPEVAIITSRMNEVD